MHPHADQTFLDTEPKTTIGRSRDQVAKREVLMRHVCRRCKVRMRIPMGQPLLSYANLAVAHEVETTASGQKRRQHSSREIAPVCIDLRHVGNCHVYVPLATLPLNRKNRSSAPCPPSLLGGCSRLYTKRSPSLRESKREARARPEMGRSQARGDRG